MRPHYNPPPQQSHSPTSSCYVCFACPTSYGRTEHVHLYDTILRRIQASWRGWNKARDFGPTGSIWRAQFCEDILFVAFASRKTPIHPQIILGPKAGSCLWKLQDVCCTQMKIAGSLFSSMHVCQLNESMNKNPSFAAHAMT